jgi:hypothetical protein
MPYLKNLYINIILIIFGFNIAYADINITPSIGFLPYKFSGKFGSQKQDNGSFFNDFTYIIKNAEVGFGFGVDKLVVNKAGYNISYEDALASNNYFDDIFVAPIYVVTKYTIKSFFIVSKIGGAISQGNPYQITNTDSTSYITPKTAMFFGFNTGYIFKNNLILSLDFVSYEIKEDELIKDNTNNSYNWKENHRFQNKFGASIGYKFKVSNK